MSAASMARMKPGLPPLEASLSCKILRGLSHDADGRIRNIHAGGEQRLSVFETCAALPPDVRSASAHRAVGRENRHRLPVLDGKVEGVWRRDRVLGAIAGADDTGQRHCGRDHADTIA